MRLTLVIECSRKQVVFSSTPDREELLNLSWTLTTFLMNEMPGILGGIEGFSINISKEEVNTVGIKQIAPLIGSQKTWFGIELIDNSKTPKGISPLIFKFG